MYANMQYAKRNKISFNRLRFFPTTTDLALARKFERVRTLHSQGTEHN